MLTVAALLCVCLQNPTQIYIAYGQTAEQETIFLLQPSQAICTSTETYVFDTADMRLKVYTHQSEYPTLREENNAKTYTKPLVGMHTFSNMLVTFIGENGERELEILNMQTLQPVTIQDSEQALERFADKTTFTLVSSENENEAYMFVLEQKTIYQYKLIKQSENEVVLQGVHNYEINNGTSYATLQNILTLQDTTYVATENQIYKVLFGSDGLSCNLEEVANINKSSVLLAGLTIHQTPYLVYVTQQNETSYVALYNTQTQEITQTDIAYAEQTYMYGANNQLLLTQNKTVVKYTFTLNKGTLSYTQKDVASNAGFQTPPQETWLTYENLQYAITNTSAQLYALPFDAEPLVSIATGKYVTLLTEAYVNHFVYCMYTDLETNQNYYGYIALKQLNIQSPNPIKASFVTITSSEVQFHNLPSSITDTHVQALEPSGKLTEGTKVTVLSKLASYHISNDTQTKIQYFYLVQLPDGTKAFVRTTSVTGVVVEVVQQQRIITNAELTENVVVYATNNGENEFDTLKKGTRIKVIAQDTRLKYTQIVYNDAEGNAITGYVLTSAIHNDSLSTLQIVGIVLIVVNVILLCIFIYCKKRVLND